MDEIIEKEKREILREQLSNYKSTEGLTYRQLADEIGIDGITWNVVAHMIKGEEVAAEKVEAIRKWLEIKLAQREAIGHDRDSLLLGFQEIIDAHVQMRRQKMHHENGHVLTALRPTAREIIDDCCAITGGSIVDVASKYVMAGKLYFDEKASQSFEEGE